MFNIKTRMAQLLFDLAWKLDYKTLNKTIEDNGYGFCEDCDERRSDEPSYYH